MSLTSPPIALRLSSRINDISPRRRARNSDDIIIDGWRGRSSGIAISALMVPGRAVMQYTRSERKRTRLRKTPRSSAARFEVPARSARRNLDIRFLQEDNVRKAKAAPANAGDARTWTAICADTKLLITVLVGQCSTDYALLFVDDLRSRLAHRAQITSDGHRPYLTAMATVFGDDADYAMLQKIYGADRLHRNGTSPAICLGATKRVIYGLQTRAEAEAWIARDRANHMPGRRRKIMN